MPRVSEEHLERRRRQILDAARACFIRTGFHQTSMQDIFKESGLSAGAVYRYFPSKTEIIQAIATEHQGAIVGLLERMHGEPELPPIEDVIFRFATQLSAGLRDGGPLSIAPQGWAAAVYDEEIGVIVRGLFDDTREWWIKLAQRMHDEGALPADADPRAVGSTLFCLMPGYALQFLLLGGIDPDTIRAGLRGIIGSA